jgi:hypothetical protein
MIRMGLGLGLGLALGLVRTKEVDRIRVSIAAWLSLLVLSYIKRNKWT